MASHYYYFIKNKRLEERKKITLTFSDYEMDLIIKSLSIAYKYNEKHTVNLYFRNKEVDKDCIFYLHRILSCKCNDTFYNIDNDFFILNRNF